MKTLIVGDESRADELIECLPESAIITREEGPYHVENLSDFDFIFDLSCDDEEYGLDPYIGLSKTIVIVSSIKTQLAEMADPEQKYGLVIGLNCLPGFVNRILKEVSLLDSNSTAQLGQAMLALGWQYQLVKDRVGMVTPRIIFMIINEACYTVQEGTASIKDIDSSMKLGTAYPKGPFEWADEIGVSDVYETLEAIFLDTGDERYKICPLLKSQYLKQATFYSQN